MAKGPSINSEVIDGFKDVIKVMKEAVDEVKHLDELKNSVRPIWLPSLQAAGGRNLALGPMEY